MQIKMEKMRKLLIIWHETCLITWHETCLIFNIFIFEDARMAGWLTNTDIGAIIDVYKLNAYNSIIWFCKLLKVFWVF